MDRPHKLPKLLLLLLMSLAWMGVSSARAHGPDQGVQQALTTEDGLPLNWVSDFAEASDGALWIATDSGLVWYDGVELIPDPATAGERILQLLADPAGGTWAASWDKLWRIDGREVVAMRVHRASLGLPFHVDTAGGVWAVEEPGLVSLRDRGLRVDTPPGCGALKAGRGPSLTCEDGTPLTLADGELRVLVDVHGLPLPGPELLRDSRGVSWVPTAGRVRRYIREARGFRELEAVPALDIDVIAILESSDGQIWLATADNRVLVWDGAERVEHTQLERQVRLFFEDHGGGLWVATPGLGALRLSSPHSFETVVGGPDVGVVWTSVEAPDGTLWLGTDGGLVRVAPGAEPTRVPGLAEPVHSLMLDADGTLYAGGDAGLSAWDGETLRSLLFADADVRVRGGILRDREGRLWVGGRRAVWRAPTVDAAFTALDLPVTLSLAYPEVGAIVEDADGRVLVATNAGLLVWDDDDAPRVVVEGHLRGLSASEDGTVWATRAGGGLVRVRAGESSELGPKQGLPTETLHAVVFDHDGSTWLSSNRGIFRTRSEDLDAAANEPNRVRALSLTNYGIDDGLPTLECNSGYPSSLVDARGRIHFPTMRGLVRVDPDELRRDLEPPVPSIRLVKVDAEEVPLGGALVLPPGTRSVAVHYSAPKLRDPTGVTYRYRLEGHDEDWVDAEHRRVALWTNLPPGAYTFRLQARSGEGVPSEVEATLSFTVEAQLHERGWFQVLLAVGSLSLGVVLVRGQVYRIRDRELARLVDERTAELKAARDLSAEQAGRLADQARALEAIDARKTRFFANVSHELRTPLALIRGPVSGALSSGDTLSPTDLERVDRNARRLEDLIEELLDIARLDAGKLPLHAREQDLATHLEARVEAFGELARRSGLSLGFEGPATQVWFDGRRLQKVIDNLLVNAIRHTQTGGDVRVVLSTTETHAEVRVADTGSGIDPAHLPHIFERFYQAPGTPHSRAATRGSAGLGLALSRELTQRHGGELSVDSELGEGSVFTLRLPLGRAHLRPEDVQTEAEDRLASFDPARALAEPVHAPSTATVLVVEDDPDMRAFIRQVLSVRYAVLEASDGVEGLELARAQVPDLVLTDAMMPARTGYELCAALREDLVTSHLPVVMLSARSAADSRVEGLASGVDVYLAKPFHPHELLLQLDNLLAARARLQARHHRQLVTQDDNPEVASVDDRFLAQVREAIHAHMSDENFGVNELAEAVFLSRRQLSRKLSSLIGEPPSALIRRLRLARGKALLEQDAGSISEVAYAVGFRRPARFSEQFRAEFGMSPSQFKQE